MNAANIKIIGSVSPYPITIDVAEELFGLPETDLSHGDVFTGKPSTILHVNEHYVLKGQRTLSFASKEVAEAWANVRLKKDADSLLYHPKKTWLIKPIQKSWTVYNVSPRLKPLHVAIEGEGVSAEEKLSYLTKLTQLYLAYAATYEERLDEGLSNFGMDSEQHVYYLDDDFYGWDHLLSFTGMVALWLRKFSHTWLDEHAAESLGSMLREQVKELFKERKGVDYLGSLNEHLSSLYLNGEAVQRMQTICYALRKKEEPRQDKIKQVELARFPLRVPEVAKVKEAGRQDVKAWLKQAQPIAILADIHANLPALDVVLDDLKQQGIERILCLGDIVGYGPHPSECIDRLQAIKHIFTIRGNHDHMIGNNKILKMMSKSGLEVAKWTVNQLQSEQRHWLAELPLRAHWDEWMLVHGAPRDATFFNAYVYERTADANLEWMQAHGVSYCFHGHSHLQGVYQMKNGVSKHSKKLETYALQGNDASLICSGAVGQPRSGTPGAEYAVFYPETKELTLKRLDYDRSTVLEDMKKHGFPEQLLVRLEQGF